MRFLVLHASMLVLFGSGASPVTAQTADTAMTPHGEPVLAPVGPMTMQRAR